MSRSTASTLAVFAAALGLLAALGGGTEEARSGQRPAVEAALADPEVSAYLRRHPHRSTRVLRLDGSLRRVSFLEGSRVVLEVAVDRQGRVRAMQRWASGDAKHGGGVVHSPVLLAGMTALLLLALIGVPLVSLRNLDVLAVAALTLTIPLNDAGQVGWSALLGALLLAYLGVRCLRAGWRDGGDERPWRPLVAHLGRRLPAPDLVRLAKLGAGGAAVALVVLSVVSGFPADIGLASLMGATLLTGGELPYGAMPSDVVHGDTYPLLAYVIYLPAALVAPVHDAFDDPTGALAVAAALTLAAAAGVHRAARGAAAGVVAPLALTASWLLFPPAVVAAAAGDNGLAVACALAWSVALAAGPGRGALALALGAWAKAVPLAVVPLWLARERGSDLRLALVAVGGVTAAMLMVLVSLGGPGAPVEMVRAMAFQLDRESLSSLWVALGAEPARIVAQAAVVAAIWALSLRIRALPGASWTPTRMAALGAAVLIGVQLAANHWSYLYLAWLYPLLVLGLLAPGSVERERVAAA